MTLTSLQVLGWSTVTVAVSAALLLASGESDVSERARAPRGEAVRASIGSGTLSVRTAGAAMPAVSQQTTTVSTR